MTANMSRMSVCKEKQDEHMSLDKTESDSSPDFLRDCDVLSKESEKNLASSSVNHICISEIHRYSRSTLLLLRNNVWSKRRPECALRSELQSLGVWKVHNGFGSNHQNGDVGNNTAVSGSGNNNMSHVASQINTRLQRSPSRRNVMHISNSIDQRTVSSAHLMPAFAKRRFGVPSVVGVSLSTIIPSGGNFPTLKPESQTELAKEVDYSNRLGGEEQFSDRQRTKHRPSVNFLSPQRKSLGACDYDSSNRTEVYNSGSTSPGSQSYSNNRHGQSISGNERRIGSGRLLHCDVNWDYCAAKDNIKDSADKTASGTNHHHTQKTRFNERERNDRSTFAERRFDRKSSDFNGTDKLENLNTNSPYIARPRHVFSNEIDNISCNVQAGDQRLRSRRHYNDRNDEPEWFSEGPTSQHDTIELRGFDERDEEFGEKYKIQKKKISERSSSHTNSVNNFPNSNSKDQLLSQAKELFGSANTGSSTATSVTAKNSMCYTKKHAKTNFDEQRNDNAPNNDGKLLDQLTEQEERKHNAKQDYKKKPLQFGFSDFNFDEFFNIDPLNDSLMGNNFKHDCEQSTAGSSRFSRWFATKNNQPETIPRTTIHIENETQSDDIANITKTEAGRGIYSPGHNESSNAKQSNTLMQFFQQTILPPALAEGAQPHGGITSVEELEARMRKMLTACDSTTNDEKQNDSVNKHDPVNYQLPEQADSFKKAEGPSSPKDTEAFKKLLEQLGSASNINSHYSQKVNENPGEINEDHTSSSVSQYIPENSYATELSQNEEYKKFIKHQDLTHPRRYQHKHSHLQRPNESAFSATSSYMSTVCENAGMEPVNMLQDVQCIREIPAHAQNIIENTITKRKVEEQENLKRKLETPKHSFLPILSGKLESENNKKTLHQYPYQLKSSTGLTMQLSPQNSQILQTPSQQQHHLSTHAQAQQQHNNSPTPLAFTPTSVLRKMTAEKESSSAAPSVQHQQAVSHMHTSNPLSQHQRSQIHAQPVNKNMPSVLHQHHLMQPQSHQPPLVITSQPLTVQQPRMILGGGGPPQKSLCSKQATPQQHLAQTQKHPVGIHTSAQSQRLRSNHQQLKWQVPSALSQQQVPVSKPTGRPILKGPLQTQQQKPQQLISPVLLASKMEFQQIQQQQNSKNNPSFQAMHPQQHFPITQHQSQHGTHTNIMTHLPQHLFQNQQQQRVPALHRGQHIQLQQMHQQQHFNRPTGLIGPNQSHCAANGPATSGNAIGVINYQRDGGLSPTSNQLAQWFSPELLAQATAGKLPLLNVNEALSLEEFERSIQHSSASVHN